MVTKSRKSTVASASQTAQKETAMQLLNLMKRCQKRNIPLKDEYTVEETHLLTGYKGMNITSRCRGINSASKKPYPADRRIKARMITNASNRSQWLIAAESVDAMIVWYDQHVDNKIARRDHPENFGKAKSAVVTLESVLAKEVKAGDRTQESMDEILTLAHKR